MGPPYGWSQDAVDGALLALMAAKHVRASKNGLPQLVKDAGQGQIGVLDFYSESIVVDAAKLIVVRKHFSDLGLRCDSGEESAVAAQAIITLKSTARSAGGEPPAPDAPSTLALDQLAACAGNEQLLKIYQQRDQLATLYASWATAAQGITQRLPTWRTLEQLARHARSLPGAAAAQTQIDAIRATRALLSEPDPVPPLLQTVATALRTALNDAHARLLSEHQAQLAQLQASPDWQALPESQRAAILRQFDLAVIPAVNVATTADLLATLNLTPLDEWEKRIVALPIYVGKARAEAARVVSGGKAVTVPVLRTTLKTEADVDTYLDNLRQDIMPHIAAGESVTLT
jgi:hypothetical protein